MAFRSEAPQTRGVGAAAGPPLAPGAERPHGPLAGRGDGWTRGFGGKHALVGGSFMFGFSGEVLVGWVR